HPGGGGQPHDRGWLEIRGRLVPVTAVREDGKGCIWQQVEVDLAPRDAVHGLLDWPYRHALMRHHALMHIVNTVAWRRFSALTPGVQIGADRSPIDFRLGDFARERIGELESLVNAVIERALPISSSVLSEEQYRARPELIRTANVLPPIVDGRVRVVTI